MSLSSADLRLLGHTGVVVILTYHRFILYNLYTRKDSQRTLDIQLTCDVTGIDPTFHPFKFPNFHTRLNWMSATSHA